MLAFQFIEKGGKRVAFDRRTPSFFFLVIKCRPVDRAVSAGFQRIREILPTIGRQAKRGGQTHPTGWITLCAGVDASESIKNGERSKFCIHRKLVISIESIDNIPPFPPTSSSPIGEDHVRAPFRKNAKGLKRRESIRPARMGRSWIPIVFLSCAFGDTHARANEPKTSSADQVFQSPPLFPGK